MAREAMDLCLKVLKESNKTKFDSYSVRKQCIDHIPYYLSGLSRAHFSPTTFLKIAVYICQKAQRIIVTEASDQLFVYKTFRSSFKAPGGI